jgi:hypothetical protein
MPIIKMSEKERNGRAGPYGSFLTRMKEGKPF